MPKCKDCKWWIRVADWGDCHRHAPITKDENTTGIYNPIWPQTNSYQGCGEFESKGEKDE